MPSTISGNIDVEWRILLACKNKVDNGKNAEKCVVLKNIFK